MLRNKPYDPMNTTRVLECIFEKLNGTTKWQLKFFIELFDLVYSIQGRFNFQNICRYSVLNESTFRRNFQKFFDWLDFNIELIKLSGVRFSKDELIAAMDCSFIPKAGNSTWGRDRFWSSLIGRAKKGLEISLLCLIEVKSGKAWALDVRQTPSGLSTKENDDSKTRIDFYLDQILTCSLKLLKIKYFVGDGYYAKRKVFETLKSLDKFFITKLRPDANLRLLYKGPKTRKQGRPKKYGAKVDFFGNKTPWKYEGQLSNTDVYSITANSPHFKTNLKIVMLVNPKTDKHILLASTDLTLCSFKIIDYYRLRFKIEFLFRDAKQFTGLSHCQARSKQKLNFHFNFSLAAVNMANLQMQLNPTIMSMNTFKRLAYNSRFVKYLFLKLRPLAKVDINSSCVKDAIQLGKMWA